MLVLTRKKAETIKIGNDIVITVIQTGKGTVRLGIEAPAHVRVLRGELAPHPAVETTSIDDEEAAMERFLTELNTLFGMTEGQEQTERLPLVAEAAL